VSIFLSCQILKKLNSNQDHLSQIKNSIGMELIEIPTGDFAMGCRDGDPNCDEDEIPNRKTYITNPFYIGKYEVTKGEFSKFISETGFITEAEKLGFKNTWKNCHGMKQTDLHPVICVSWNDAIQFTKWISSKENKKYRLPTEAEWEYSARANDGNFNISKTENLNLSVKRYYWGFDINESFAWFNKNSNRETHPVGEKKPNAWGIYDISGNVWEWCEDSYDSNFFKRDKKIEVLNDNYKVLRGGSWFDSFLFLRISARNFALKETRESHFGFRVVMER